MLGATRFVELPEGKIAYHRSGNGPTIVLVHGITTYSFIWRDVAAILEKQFDVVTIDLLGCGESDMPLDVSYAISDHADRLHDFVKALGIEKFHLVGHDLGGGIGQIFSVHHPEMLHDLTLVNSVGYDFWPVQPITALRTPVIRQMMMATFDTATFRLVVKRGLYHKSKLTPELMERFMAPMNTSQGRKAFMHFARCLDNHDLMSIAEKLESLAVPTLVVRGTADPYLGSAISERLNRDLPNSRLESIDTASHFIQIDEPEWLASRIVAFAGERHD